MDRKQVTVGGREGVHFIIVTRPEIDHDVFVSVHGLAGCVCRGGRGVPVEEHEGTWVVQFVHLRRGLVVRRPRGKGNDVLY